MKVRVQYYGGHHVDFVVPEDILMVDFVEMAKVHGKIRTLSSQNEHGHNRDC
jgi:hypothetical protein